MSFRSPENGQISEDENTLTGGQPGIKKLTKNKTRELNQKRSPSDDYDDDYNEEEHSLNGNGYYKKAEVVNDELSTTISESDSERSEIRQTTDDENGFARDQLVNVKMLRSRFESDEKPSKRNRHFYSLNEPDIRREQIKKKSNSIFMKTESFKEYQREENDVTFRYGLDNHHIYRVQDLSDEKFIDSLDESSVVDSYINAMKPINPAVQKAEKGKQNISYKESDKPILIVVEPPSERENVTSYEAPVELKEVEEEPLQVEKRARPVLESEVDFKERGMVPKGKLGEHIVIVSLSPPPPPLIIFHDPPPSNLQIITTQRVITYGLGCKTVCLLLRVGGLGFQDETC